MLATIRTCIYLPEETCQWNKFKRVGNDSLLNYTLKNGKFIPADYSKQIIQSPLGSTVKPVKWVTLGHFCWNRVLLMVMGERLWTDD